MPSLESVVSALNDPIKSGSYNMRVLRVLLTAERSNEWLTPGQIAERAGIPESAVGSRIRDLRTQGFRINRVRELGLWTYRVFFAPPENE
jgi:biotin operon repressor